MSSPDSGVIHSPKASDTSPTYGADDEESRLRARLLAKKAQSSRDKVEKSPITSQQPRSVVLPPSGSKSVPKSPSRESSKHHHHHHKKKKKRRASSENEGGSGDEKSKNSVNKVAAPSTTLATKKTQGSRRVVEIDDDIQNVINAKIAERLGSSSSVAKISATEIFDLKSRDNDDVVKNVSDEELESLGPNIQPPQASRKMTKSSEKYYHRDFKRRGEEISPESYSKRRHLDVGYGPLSSHSKMTSRHVSLHSSVESRDKPAKSTAKTSAQEDSMHRRSREISSSRDKSDLNDDRKKRYEKQLKDYDTKKCRIESKRHKSPGHDEKRSKIESVSSEIPNEKERQNREKNRRRASEEGRISSPSPAHVTTPTQDELEDKHENDEVEHTENPPILDANSEISAEEIASGSRRRKSRSPSRGSLESGEQRSDDETEKNEIRLGEVA
uniref:Uncharacterized protein n=1 Tax=Romanomermis culicivorax TaxID=13658 RepID=A0A915IZX4_ROMCU